MKHPIVNQVWVLFAVASLGLVGWKGQARAASGDDPLLVSPEILIVLDTSGSMLAGTYKVGSCADSDPLVPEYDISPPAGAKIRPGCTLSDCVRNGRKCQDDTDTAKLVTDPVTGFTMNVGWDTAPRHDGYWWATCSENPLEAAAVLPPLSYTTIDGNVINNVNSYVGSPTCLRNRFEVIREVLTGSYCTTPDATWSLTNCCLDMTCCPKQAVDGLLDSYKDSFRFGFATFDNWDPTWSYGSNAVAGVDYGIKGRLDNYGPLVDVVNKLDPANLEATNTAIQDEVCSGVGLGGGTPINYALQDAADYYTNYRTELGIGADPMLKCRSRYVILLTDGVQSGGYAGHGPPESFAEALCAMGIPVFVIGFGAELAAASLDLIARAGSGEACTGVNTSPIPDNSVPTSLTAFYAADQDDLREHFQSIFNAILTGISSHTNVVSTTPDYANQTSYVYGSFYEISRTGKDWTGFLVRQKLTSTSSGSWDWAVGSSDCDPATTLCFHETIKQKDWDERSIYTIAQDPRSACQATGGCSYPRPVGTSAADDLIPFSVANKSDLKTPMCQSTVGDTEALIRYVLGDPAENPSGVKLGDIIHSNLEVVPPPTGLTEDWRYEAFFRVNKDRYTMLYVGANDGMLHAFIAEDHKTETVGGARNREGEELWGFIPNNLLGSLYQMKTAHTYYVDGSPVIRDVYFPNLPLMDPANPTEPLKINNQPVLGTYRTVLISGERGGGGAYFALDVTDPENPRYLWEYRVGVHPGVDYDSVQCAGGNKIETWAEPIIGQLWLKNGDTDTFVSKTVMIVPGGVSSPGALPQLTSCVQFALLMSAATQIHFVDVETGKLLRKMTVGNTAGMEAIESLLEDYYTMLASGSTDPWNPVISSDGFFKKEDKVGEYSNGYCTQWGQAKDKDPADDESWSCCEERPNFQTAPTVPPSWDCCNSQTGDRLYTKCGDKKNCTGVGDETYLFTRLAGGSYGAEVAIKRKSKTDPQIRVSIGKQIGGDNIMATPVVYNTTRGEYVSRVFVPTYRGKIFRIDTGIAKYDSTAAEGQMIAKFTSGAGTDYDWWTDKWWPEGDTTTSLGRPIMLAPTLALTYDRDLVLFFGTGLTNNLEYIDNSTKLDKVYAVKETFTIDTETSQYKVDPQGSYFEPFGEGHGVFELATAERLISKPLVIAGKVLFTTYTPDEDQCQSGLSRVYHGPFDDISTSDVIQTTIGVTTGPRAVWTPQWLQIATQNANEIRKLTLPDSSSDSLTPSYHMLYWGKVL